MTNKSNGTNKKTFWYVEYRAYGKMGYMEKIEAKDGKEAIEYVKSKVVGATNFSVWHDDED